MKEKEQKIALVLSGGGAKGRYQSRIIYRLVKEFGIKPFVVAGVSVGALNGAMVAQDKVDKLEEIWSTISADDVYKKRTTFRLVWNYLTHKVGVNKGLLGAYSNDPLFKLIQKEIEKDYKGDIIFKAGRVDISSGEYFSTSEGFLHKEILASTAIPIVWSPVEINNRFYVDGGVRNITPLGDVLKHNPDKIIVIPTQPYPGKSINSNPRDLVDVVTNTLGILLDEIFNNDIKALIEINNLVKQSDKPLLNSKGEEYKYYEPIVLSPTKDLGSVLDFSDNARIDREIHADQIFDDKFNYIKEELSL